MPLGKGNIIITFIYKGDSYIIHTYANEYSNLMTLISDRLAIPGFGLCCGMGSCGTCIVEIGSQYTSITKPVLSCDIRVNNELSNKHVTIADQPY
ncbi:MAG: 2Fe-2S iron-sulfur cluster binding domain-containing protein [Ferruginibacter sp.]|nr:2Fe-2S iron-sulfur cluster binding domain-containing protein [Ferruginibacter sp.]